MELDKTKIEEAIVAQAIGHFIGNDALYERVKKGVEARIDAMFADKVKTLIEETIEGVYKEGLDREYTKRDGFGRATGAPTSISKELERLISGYWSQQVGRDGKPSEGYGATTRAEWMLTQLCADDFSKQMKQHVVNVGGALKDHFRSVLDQQISTMLSDVFHVKSAGDEARRNPGRACIDPPAKPVGAS